MPRHVNDIERVLRAVGELLVADGASASIVIVGGAAMNLLGIVQRTTRDVDVIAVGAAGKKGIRRPGPLPPALTQAVGRVARDFALPADWLNTQVASQWDTGLPPGFAGRITWKEYGGLQLGIADRRDLVFLKLYAAADDTGPNSVHFQDLLALKPSMEELQAASAWVEGQDSSPGFVETLRKVVQHAQRQRD